MPHDALVCAPSGHAQRAVRSRCRHHVRVLSTAAHGSCGRSPHPAPSAESNVRLPSAVACFARR
eukprot:4212088-Alexandrium_andersonii.AAC.1